MTIALLDVHYEGFRARAACILAESWNAETAVASYTSDIATVAPYQPGSFYLRELPCLLAVLRLMPELPETVVIDGYVWLAPGDRPGLGARLFEALGQGASVVGIAKTAFSGAESCASVIPVLRGTSRRPLFVSAAGLDVETAAQHVRQMAGTYRIPELVKLTDRLSRSGVPGSKTATRSQSEPLH